MEMKFQPITQDAMRAQEWAMLLKGATPERKKIFETLKEKQWFQNTSRDLQKTLLTLPDKGAENHDGFLKNLSERPETLANIKVERLIDLPKGAFVVLPKFEVSRVDNPSTRFTYEYVSWRNGPLSGAKGVVFVEKEGKATHFIVLKGDKFAPGKNTFDTIGGFIDKPKDEAAIHEGTMKEIRDELGVSTLTVSRTVDLGRVLTDEGLTNNEPKLFAAFISSDEAKKITSDPVNPDIYELKNGAVVLPMKDLPKVVMENSDGLFLSTIARAWAKGIITPPDAWQKQSVSV